MQHKIKTQLGFTLVEIMIVVAIIGLLAAIAIPNFVNARTKAQTQACIVNLRQIDGAKQQWALESRAGQSDIPTPEKLQIYLGHGASGSLPTCPADSKGTFATSYSVNDIQTPPVCQINVTEHKLDR